MEEQAYGFHGGCVGTGSSISHPSLWSCLPQFPALPLAPLRLLPAQGLALCLLPPSLHAALPQGQTSDVSPVSELQSGHIHPTLPFS